MPRGINPGELQREAIFLYWFGRVGLSANDAAAMANLLYRFPQMEAAA
jgi:hypothetical protein